ncbi:MAG: Flap-structured DNA-binding and RNA-binding protein [Stictis urceolatum]|nr:Flap-structured DNA-binding and RNA-binding protein [Stictis urceolata]
MSPFSPSPLSGQNIRPSSEVYYSQAQRSQNQNHADDAMDKAAQQWIADIDQYETTLEEMAAATLDQDFKDELSAIEQWFKVLSEAERTAALYALLQQTTQVQIRFFIQVLQEMAKGHPMSGVLSPANFGEKGESIMARSQRGQKTDTVLDAMANRMSDAAGKLGVDAPRNSMGRPPPSPGAKRNSGLDPSTINAMFPDAANAIAKKKAEYTQQTGNAPTSNRNSTVGADRTSLVAPTISAPTDGGSQNIAQPSPTPWGQRSIERPKSSAGQQPMGQFSQPPPSAGLRQNRPPQLNQNALRVSENEQPLLSPYNANASWASMSNTPMVPNFNTQQAATQADMVANATAMKLAALSTVNNRIMLDDVRKYRRSRSSEGQGPSGQMAGAGIPGSVVVLNENGQLVSSPLNPAQLAALQAQQQQQLQAMGNRSRPNSPGLALSGGLPGGGMGFASPQNNGYLAAGLSGGMAGLNLGQYGMGGGHEGYMSDHSDMNRGRSPRGRRGTSKPPEDPTDPSLLQDIPAWLRSLRLHKYTDNLKDLKWEELVELDEKGLEDRGVNALGARRKMIKASISDA